MYLDIADLLVYIDKPSVMTLERSKKYISSTDKNPDITIPYDNRPYPDYATTSDIKLTVDHMREGFKFYTALMEKYNGTMLHSSAVVYENKAYLFSAVSGTGKSTHTSKWLEFFGDKAYILNDDKPAIRILKDGIYAYGTPWSGKYDISENKRVEIQGICFLSRDNNNWINRIDCSSAALRLYHGGFRKLGKDLINNQLEIINTLVSSIPIYEMGCTPTIEAAKIAYNTMSKGL